MADGTLVGDFFARLGLRVDKNSFAAGDAVLGKLKAAAGAIAGLAVGGFLTKMITDVADLGGHLSDTSHAIGISAESLQELSFAAKLSGVGVEELEASMKRLASGIADAARTGKGPMIDALETLGISIGQFRQKLSGPGGIDDVLSVIANSFQKMPDGIKKTDAAMAIFGKTGANLIPLLNEGADGIDKLRERANELGIVIDEDSVGKLDTFGDTVDEIKTRLTGLRNTVVVRLLPALQDLANRLGDWIDKNREALATGLEVLVEALTLAFTGLGTALNIVTEVIKFFKENTELAQATLIAITAALGVFAVQAAIAWAAALGPITLVIAALAGIVLAVKQVIKHWDILKTGFISGAKIIKDVLYAALILPFKLAGEAIGRFAGFVVNLVRDIARGVVDFFVDAFDEITTEAGKLWDTIKAGFKEAFEFVAELPVIKQLVDAANAILGIKEQTKSESFGHRLGRTVSGSTTPDAAVEDAFFGPAPGDAEFKQFWQSPEVGTSNNKAPTTINGGDVSVNVTVQGGGDPAAIGEAVARHVGDQMDAWLRHADSVVG